ncbi:MAG: acetyl-CoA carboxylase biotin carboxyl carrier protein subunit [Chloroflexi bacterium]|nr:acetyl-CoA carboxylase biotin carboxyl carrier protein subunit [Chloroflexota bacterium]
MDREFTITLDGSEYRVEMHGNTVLVNGVPFVVGFEGGGVTVDGTLYEVTLAGDTAEVNGIPHTVAFEGLGPVRSAAPTAVSAAPVREVAEGAGVIKAIMPGKVIRVFVAEGDEVEEGDVAVILEAMKMENELCADRGGVVQQVAVAPGDDVELGQVLVVIE